MASGGQEKTEKPTPRRLQEARKKGQVAKSTDVNTAVVLLAAIVILRYQAEGIGHRLSELARRMLSEFPKEDFTVGSLYALSIGLGTETALMLAPTLLFLLIAGVLANYLQIGVLFSLEAIKPKFDKISPLQGFKRMFSRRSLVETLKALVKMGIVGWVVFQAISERYPQMAGAALMDKASASALFGSVAWEIAWRSVFVLIIFGLIDLFYQRWEYEKGLKMSKQEVKDESKQAEGDPIIKGRIRQAQRQMARRRMMSEVPKATVVITNPTHYAIALRYDRDSMEAPRVVAKGVDLVAQRIKEIARENGVPTVENVPLARALYKKADIDEEIPEDLYKAVAEILVMVQKMNKKRAARV